MRPKGLDDAYKKVLGKKGFSIIDPDSRYEIGDEPSEVEVSQDVQGESDFKRKAWRDDSGRLHRIGGPALIIIDSEPESYDHYGISDNEVYKKMYGWYQHGKLHNLDGPALLHMRDNPRSGKSYVYRKEFYINGKLHRESGPAKIRNIPNWNGEIHEYEWYNHGKLVRGYKLTKGLGWEYTDVNGELHKEDGPAQITTSKYSIVKTLNWYIHGKRHRVGGPAIVRYDTANKRIMSVDYYINGIPYTKEEYEQYYKDVSKDDHEMLTDLGQTFD